MENQKDINTSDDAKETNETVEATGVVEPNETLIPRLREDVKNRGKEAILDILDNYDCVNNPELKSLLLEHRDTLNEIKTEQPSPDKDSDLEKADDALSESIG